jgi:hypothetical protein
VAVVSHGLALVYVAAAAVGLSIMLVMLAQPAGAAAVEVSAGDRAFGQLTSAVAPLNMISLR